MVKGYVRQKIFVVFKGPWMLYWKERGEGKKAVRLIIVLRRLVFETIPQDVKKEHNIERALKDEDKVEKIAKEIDQKSYMLAFNVELELEKVLEILDKIEKSWEILRMSGKIKSKDEAALLSDVDKFLQKELIRVLDEEDSIERDVYFKLLEPVIKSAESETKEAMMVKVAQFFKTREDISRFASIAFRWEARGARMGFAGLKKDLRVVENIFSRIEEGKGNARKLANSLREIDIKIVGHVKNEFRSTYLLLKRDLLLDMVLLGLLNTYNKEIWEFVQHNLMPRAPELKNMQDLKDVREEIAEHGHVIAQGLRRLIAKGKEVESRARKELSAAGRIVVRPPKVKARRRKGELVGAGV